MSAAMANSWPPWAIAAAAAAVGLRIRQELGRRHCKLLTLPLSAAFLGAIISSLAIRQGWTHTPQLALIVPALMLVPGPHLINAVLDLLDNFVPMCLARLGLATGILLSSALGIALGMELILSDPVFAENAAGTDQLNLLTDMLLAAVASCGFAVFYNVGWQQVPLAAVGGMAGHGLRYLALQAGLELPMATFIGGLTVGLASAWMARSDRRPVAVIAFAGAVTMIPGLHMYRALGGAVKLVRLTSAADSALVAETVGSALQAGLIVGALALGLILGVRAIQTLNRETMPESAR